MVLFGFGYFFFFLRSNTHFLNSYGTDSVHGKLRCQNLTHSNYYHSAQKTKETQILSALILAMVKSYCLHRGLKQSKRNGSWVKRSPAFGAWPALKEQSDYGDTMRTWGHHENTGTQWQHTTRKISSLPPRVHSCLDYSETIHQGEALLTTYDSFYGFILRSRAWYHQRNDNHD